MSADCVPLQHVFGGGFVEQESQVQPYTQEGLELLLRASRHVATPPPISGDKRDLEDQYCFDPERVDKALDRAKAEGLILVAGDEHTLTLDLDDGAEINAVVLAKLSLFYGDFIVDSWLSKSGRGRHVTLRFPNGKFTEAEAVALEAALGSDPLRAVFCVGRVQNGVSAGRVLFRPPTTEDVP